MSNNHDLYVRVQARPTLPPALGLPLLFCIPVGLGLAYDFMRFNGDKIFLFIFMPLVVWFVYGRRARRNGRVMRAYTVTLLAPLLFLGPFSAWRWINYNTPLTGHYGLTKWDMCQYHVPDLKMGKVSGEISYNNCENLFDNNTRQEICTRLKSENEQFPQGSDRCNAIYRNGNLR